MFRRIHYARRSQRHPPCVNLNFQTSCWWNQIQKRCCLRCSQPKYLLVNRQRGEYLQGSIFQDRHLRQSLCFPTSHRPPNFHAMTCFRGSPNWMCHVMYHPKLRDWFHPIRHDLYPSMLNNHRIWLCLVSAIVQPYGCCPNLAIRHPARYVLFPEIGRASCRERV